MTLTRDQLRAARMLLHLQQSQLAELAGVGVATIKRFETGNGIRSSQAGAVRRALEEAGAVLVDGEGPVDVPTGIGVVLRPAADLPEPTLARISAEELRDAKRIEADRLRREANRSEPSIKRPLGRPKSVV